LCDCYNCLQIQINDSDQGAQQHCRKAHERAWIQITITEKYSQIKDKISKSSASTKAHQ